jgi:DNA-binding transcriptional LysR family regulator
VARKLADHQRVLAASPGYIEQHGMPLEPSDLPTHNCIGNPRLSSYPIWRLSDGEQVEAVRTNGTLQTNDSMAMLEAARAGIGILGAGEWLLARDLAAGKLVRILPDARWARRRCSVGSAEPAMSLGHSPDRSRPSPGGGDGCGERDKPWRGWMRPVPMPTLACGAKT